MSKNKMKSKEKSFNDDGARCPAQQCCTLSISGLLGIFVLMPLLAYTIPMIPRTDLEWWETVVTYQVYPRSFQDSDGDGVGDLPGITSRLDYLQSLGVGCIWLSPIYKSPMKDFGYDVADHKQIDPVFGTMHDFKTLINAVHDRDMKLMMDYIPNHTSDQHAWFTESRKGGTDNPYGDYYIWHNGKLDKNGARTPPNNWLSAFGGSAWEWDETRQQYYFHWFTKQQPDLNYRNPRVVKEMQDVLRFWLDAGVDGFRVDAVQMLFETENVYQDEPPSNAADVKPDEHSYLDHTHTLDQPGLHDIVKGWRNVLENHRQQTDKYIYMVVEAWHNLTNWAEFYSSGADQPFNFQFSRHDGPALSDCGGTCISELVQDVLKFVPKGKHSNWVLGNHDIARITGRGGSGRAAIFNMLMLLLPGTCTTYYGEEIGMHDITVPYEHTQDPLGINAGKERYMKVSRDPCRAPMQWNDSPQAGFSQSQKTWLPVHQNYRKHNVQIQEEDEKSILSLYKKAVNLRGKEPAFLWGDFIPATVTENVYSFIRYALGGLHPKFFVMMNFGKEPSTDNYRGKDGLYMHKITVKIPQTATVVYDTHHKYDVGSYVDLESIHLDSKQGLVVKFIS